MSIDWLPGALWRGGIAVVPLAVLAAAAARLLPCRPSTRHALWLVVLMVLVASPLLPRLDIPQLPVGPPERDPTPLTALVAPRVGESPAPTASLGPPAAAAMKETEPWPRQDAGPTGGAEFTSAPEAQSRGTMPQRLTGTSNEGREWSPRASTGGVACVKPAPSCGAASHSPRHSAPCDALAHSVLEARWRPLALPRIVAPATPRPEPVAVVTPAPRKQLAAATDDWSPWIAWLDAIREALSNPPPVSPWLWAGGLGAIMLVALARIARSLRLLRGGRAAPPSVRRMVADVASQIGLRRPPVVLVVEAPVTPMLWCGRTPTLVLPRGLWAQLDEAGRQAVVCHELAHLKRRDHWVCRAEMLIGWAYWWNPVVWWVRHKLRDEADHCCDLWVTALLPEGRRAYALALLQARQCDDSPTAATIGLGATTNRARRFARRLTMIMTEQMNPRLSCKGLALAGAFALAGALAAPLWACPPEETQSAQAKAEKEKAAQKKARKKEEARAGAAPLARAAPKPAARPRTPAPPAPPVAPPPPALAPDGATTYEQFMRSPEGRDGSVEQRIEALERQLDRLQRQLEELLRSPRSMLQGIGDPGGMFSMPAVVYAAPSGDPCEPGFLGGAADSGGPVEVRAYAVADGKREALLGLMVRPDVPIRVRQTEEGIEVHASAGQQRVFEAFCSMINGADQVQAYSLTPGKLEALSELMVRSDVPVFVEVGDEAIKVHGSDLVQSVFCAFARMIDPGESHAISGQVASELAQIAARYEAEAAAQTHVSEQLKATYKALHRQFEAFERQADRTREQADRLREKADSLQEQADELREEADEASSDKKREAIAAKVATILEKAEALMVQASELEAQADMLEDQARAVEEQAEIVEQQAEEQEAEDEEDEEAEEHEDEEDDE